MLTDEDRKYILNRLLSKIYDISDVVYQIRTWIRGEGPEADDFDETVNLFFDYIEIISENYKAYGISDSQYQLLLTFTRAFEAFSNKNNCPPLFINSAEWKQIIQMAKALLKSFNYQKIPEVLTKEKIKFMINQLLGIIFSMSNTESPEKPWVLCEDTEGTEWNDLTEMISHFFDEVKPILEHFKGFGLSEKQYQELKQFHDVLQAFSSEHSLTSKFTYLPDWEKIREMAKDVLRAFNYGLQA